MKFTKYFIRSVSIVLLAGFLIGAAGCEKEIEMANVADAPVADQLPMPEEYKDGTQVTELSTTMLKNPATFHPLFVTDEDTRNLLSLIFEPAIELDASDKPSASIIENWSYSEEAGTVFQFNVRKGVKFHGGNGEVTAEDLVYCLDQIMAADPTECLYAKYKGTVVSYEATSAYQLTVRVTNKTVDIFYLMSFPVVPKNVYLSRGKTTKDKPVGTGPYQVESYSDTEGMELVRNEDWWQVAPSIEKITASPVEDNESKIAGYQLGTYNFVSATQMTANTYSAMNHTSFYKSVTPYYEALIPNMKNRYLQEQKFRQAISYAIDRREVVSNGVLGGGLATTTALRPDLWYFEGESSLVEYDVAKAKELLNELGYFESETSAYRYTLNADGTHRTVKLKLIYCESEDLYYRSGVAEQIVLDLKEIGIELEVEELEFEEFRQALANGNFDLAFASFYTKTNNDVSYLFMNGAELNYGGFSDSELESLIALSRVAVDEEELKSAYQKLNEALNEKLPHIGLYFREYVTYVDSNLSGLRNLKNGAVFADVNEWK